MSRCTEATHLRRCYLYLLNIIKYITIKMYIYKFSNKINWHIWLNILFVYDYLIILCNLLMYSIQYFFEITWKHIAYISNIPFFFLLIEGNTETFVWENGKSDGNEFWVILTFSLMLPARISRCKAQNHKEHRSVPIVNSCSLCL